MKRASWMAMAAAVACAASVGVSARDDDKSITVSGCVQNFSSTDTTGVTEHGFLLSNPTLVPERGDAAPVASPSRDTSVTGTPTGTSGTAAAGMPTSGTWVSTAGAVAPRPKKAYRLDGNDEELKAQVGHKVEIAGVIEPKNGADAKGDTDRLQVSKIKILATDCTK